MKEDIRRRDFLSLLGVGGVVFASGLVGCGGASAEGATPTTTGRPGGPPPGPPREDFFFLQLSDTHWGFKGPPNPEADNTLKRAIATINASTVVPDFIVFTGDLTQTTDDSAERRARMRQFKEIVAELKVKDVRFIPGEHDAAPDRGEAYREAFGDTRWVYDHKGVHFVALDNVSDATGALGEAQIAWLASDLAKTPAETPVVVLAHRPLFDLYPSWDWATRDGAKAIEAMSGRSNVTVFYGHVHQEHHHTTGNVSHHAARSLVFPLPAPGSQPKRAPVPWDAASHDHGLGWREIALHDGAPRATEKPYG